MAHDHGHHHPKGNIQLAFFLNLGFTLVEVAGGLYTGSLAVLSDALHDAGDSLSLGLAWYFQKLSKKDSDQEYSYGYRRFSLLGAVINSVVLILGSFIILFHAIPALWNPGDPDSQGMMLLAVLGIIVNGAAVFTMKKGESLNEKVVTLHLWEDVLGWVAVLLGGVIIYYTNFVVIDAILSVGIAGYILFNAIKNLSKSAKILLQSTPEDVDVEEIHSILKKLDHVQNVHDCHIWSLDGQYNILSIHLIVNEKTDMKLQSQIKSEAKQVLKNHSIDHITIEFETEEEECLEKDCGP